MNSSGDFFIGNQKKSSATGEETTFDTPSPGEEGGTGDGGTNIFNEVIIKNRIIVEGGDTNKTSLSSMVQSSSTRKLQSTMS